MITKCPHCGVLLSCECQEGEEADCAGCGKAFVAEAIPCGTPNPPKPRQKNPNAIQLPSRGPISSTAKALAELIAYPSDSIKVRNLPHRWKPGQLEREAEKEVDPKTGNLKPGSGFRRGDMTVLLTPDQIVMEIMGVSRETGIYPSVPRRLCELQLSDQIRLNVDTFMGLARGLFRFKDGSTSAVLDVWPAQEFIRIGKHKEDSDWEQRWQKAADAVGWEGVNMGASMVALKTSPIWAELSEFGLPYPPFDYGSGMGVRDVERATAIEYGLMKDEDEVGPIDAPDEVRGSLAGIDATERDWLMQQLKKNLGDNVSIEGDEIVYKRNKVSPDKSRRNSKPEDEQIPPPMELFKGQIEAAFSKLSHEELEYLIAGIQKVFKDRVEIAENQLIFKG